MVRRTIHVKEENITYGVLNNFPKIVMRVMLSQGFTICEQI